MGAAILRAGEAAADITVVGGIAETQDGANVVTVANSAGLIAQADVLIDFSAPSAIDGVLANAGSALSGKAIVIGTTGLTREHESRIDAVAKNAAVVTAA